MSTSIPLLRQLLWLLDSLDYLSTYPYIIFNKPHFYCTPGILKHNFHTCIHGRKYTVVVNCSVSYLHIEVYCVVFIHVHVCVLFQTSVSVQGDQGQLLCLHNHSRRWAACQLGCQGVLFPTCLIYLHHILSFDTTIGREANSMATKTISVMSLVSSLPELL